MNVLKSLFNAEIKNVFTVLYLKKITSLIQGKIKSAWNTFVHVLNLIFTHGLNLMKSFKIFLKFLRDILYDSY